MRLDPVPVLILLVVLAVACLSGCGKGEGASGPAERRLALPTERVRMDDLPIFYSASGSVVSDDRIDLSSRVVGFIQRLNVREGQAVSKGDLLVQIDPRDINEAVRQADANVAAARDDLEDAERDVEKYGKLAADGYSPTETLRKAKVRRDIARSTLAKAEAAKASALTQRDYAAILSPVDGVVVARYRNVGEMAAAGQPILTLESRRNLVLRVFVAESRMAGMTPDMSVGVHIDALPDQEVHGAILRIVPSGDPTTRRYQVDISLASNGSILPGMFGRAEFPIGQTRALLVPRAALTRRGGLDGIFVVDDVGAARFRWLRLGREWQGRVEVVDGLAAGERIVRRADEALHDGALVEDAVHG